MKKTYLNVCQGNISAREIATILSSNCFAERANEIYEFESSINGEQVKMIMTSVPGHLLNHELPSGSWEASDPILLFDEPSRKAYTFSTQKIIAKLKEEVSKCCSLIIWTENNREGDNIGFEIIDICEAEKTKESDFKTYRAKFARITQKSIENALNNLQKPDKKVSDAIDIRKEIDLKTGAAFTRLHTLVIRHVFTNIQWPKVISYGSCQFPTLNFVVERYKQYQELIAVKQTEIKLKHIVDGVITEFHCKREATGEQNILVGICEKTPIIGTVVSVEKKRIKLQKPLALTTMEMVIKITKELNITATETLQIALRLYGNGYISYPFTRQNIFPNDLNLIQLVQEQTEDAELGHFAQEILNNGGPNPSGIGDIFVFDQDHPPIYPKTYTKNLSDDQERVYKFIVKHFLASVEKDAFAEETTIHANIAGEAFEAKVLTNLAKNYLHIYQSLNDNNEIYNYQQGETLTFTSEVVDCKPSSQLLTEADLMDLMEKHRIGTIATFNKHIKKIKDNEYIHLKDDLTVVPTPLGLGLIEGYKEMDLEVCLTDPNCRTEFELDIKSICDGEEDPSVIRSKYIEIYKDIYKEVESKMSILCKTLSKHLGQEYKPILKCPQCNNDMIYNKDETRKYITCIRYPICNRAVWFNTQPETIDVLHETCSDCEIAKKITVTYEEDILPDGYTNPYTFCILCCSVKDRCNLNINKKDIEPAIGRKWKKMKLDLSSS